MVFCLHGSGAITVLKVLAYHEASEAYRLMVTNTLIGLVGILLISQTVIGDSCGDLVLSVESFSPIFLLINLVGIDT